MEDDFSNLHPQQAGSLSSEKQLGGSNFSITKSIFISVGLFVVYVVGLRIRQEILLWRERSYKLATRRRHGIPDNDRRPFNVAYAAAMVKREEKEKEASGRARRQPLKPVQEVSSVDHRDAQAGQSVKHRSVSDRQRNTASVAPPGAFLSSMSSNPVSSLSNGAYHEPSSLSPTRAGFAESNGARRPYQPHADSQSTGSNRHASRKIIDLTSDGDARKRGFDENDSDEGEPAKKSRVEGDDLIDGDDDAVWEYQASLAPKRAFKRSLGDEDESEETEFKKARDKRARKVSLDIADMEVDEEEDDDVPEMVSPARGKKRDRAEAGSTFGGDDDDSSHEDDAKARRRRRKRRTVAKRKSDAGLMRGQKRDRDMDLDEDEVGNQNETGISRKKKGKRHSNVRQDPEDSRNGSDISLDDSLASSTKGRGRQIGDIWESNGVTYKIGPNRQRLRQALVKKARHKFVMPQDSTHPDRNANLEVFVETWLTEEEYQDTKDHLLLAWQDSPKHSAEPENLSVKIPPLREAPATPAGKSLLWQSTTNAPNSSPATASPLDSPIGGPTIRPKGLRNPHRYSLASNVGLHINPFERSQTVSAKRIASRASLPGNIAASPGLSDKTNSTARPRTLSKWERQEIEASAIYKLRALKQAEIDAKLKEEKDKADKERAQKERVERERLEKERLERERVEKEKREREAAAAASVPTITVTEPSETGTGAKPPSFSFPPPPAPAAAPPPTRTPDALKATFFAPPTAAAASNSDSNARPTPSNSGNPLFSFKPSGPSPTGTSSTPANQTAPQPPSAFSFPPVSNATGASPFGPPTSSFDGQKKDPHQGGPLFSRLPPSMSGSREPQKPTSSTSMNAPTSSNAPSFSLPKPPGNSSFFPAPATSSLPSTSTQPANLQNPYSTSSTAPKFNFNPMPNKVTTPTPSTPAPTANSSISGALGTHGDAGKPSPFSFKPSPTADAGKEDGGTNAAKFSFGPSTFGNAGNAAFGNTGSGKTFGHTGGSGTPAFGATGGGGPSVFASTGSTALGPQAKDKDPVKGGFSGFGGGNATNNAFGGGSAVGGANKFAETVPAANPEHPKSMFALNTGTQATTTPSANAAASSSRTTETPKPIFAFNPPTSTTPASTTPSGSTTGGTGFSFNFSKPAASTTTPQSSPFGAPPSSSTTPAQNVFRAPSQPPSMFGFGAPATDTPIVGASTTPANTPSAFSFGAPPGSSNQQSQ